MHGAVCLHGSRWYSTRPPTKTKLTWLAAEMVFVPSGGPSSINFYTDPLPWTQCRRVITVDIALLMLKCMYCSATIDGIWAPAGSGDMGARKVMIGRRRCYVIKKL